MIRRGVRRGSEVDKGSDAEVREDAMNDAAFSKSESVVRRYVKEHANTAHGPQE